MDQTGKTLPQAKLKLARASKQLNLLACEPKFNVRSKGATRNAYGAAAQIIVCEAMGLWPIAIDGSCAINFDAEGVNDVFYEIKSVHQKSKIVIYDWRMDKEANSGVVFKYVICAHQLRGERRGDRVIGRMAKGAELFVADGGLIHRLAKTQPLNRINTEAPATSSGARNGYRRAGYKEGYRNLPLSLVRSQVTSTVVRKYSLFNRTRTITINYCTND